jgi:hypothetical protein
MRNNPPGDQEMNKPRRYRVIQSRKTNYLVPIVLKKGETVTIGEEYKEKETWKGWVWCETSEKKCWVPYQIIEKQDEIYGKLKEEYIATELNVEKDDSIEAEKELNGWVWGRNENKNENGWVPLEILEKEDR